MPKTEDGHPNQVGSVQNVRPPSAVSSIDSVAVRVMVNDAINKAAADPSLHQNGPVSKNVRPQSAVSSIDSVAVGAFVKDTITKAADNLKGAQSSGPVEEAAVENCKKADTVCFKDAENGECERVFVTENTDAPDTCTQPTSETVDTLKPIPEPADASNDDETKDVSLHNGDAGMLNSNDDAVEKPQATIEPEQASAVQDESQVLVWFADYFSNLSGQLALRYFWGFRVRIRVRGTRKWGRW